MEANGRECVPETRQITHPIFDELYQKYQNAVFGFAYYLTQNRRDAEDLFQEAWLRIVKNLPEKINMESIKAWMFAIVINLHRDSLRKKRVRRLFFLQKSMNSGEENAIFPYLSDMAVSNSSNEACQADMGRDIAQAIAKLPDRQRRIFVLKEIGCMKQAEISDMLGVPIGTVKSLMHRAVKQLRRRLSKYNTKSNQKGVEKCDVKILSV